jgi:D-3-phosphoglycerate dehydrogenase
MPRSIFDECSFDVVEREIWHESDLVPDAHAVGWITNTGWSFTCGPTHAALYPDLKVIVTPSTGSEHLRVRELEARGITVLSLLDDRAGLERIAASAEHAFLLLLNGLRGLPTATRAFDQRKWRRDMEDALRGRELQGRQVGLIGLGRIGRRLSRYCDAFGAPVLYYDPYVDHGPETSVRVETLEELFDRSDSIVVCCTLNDETSGLVGTELLRRMRPASTLVNIARGEIIDEAALATVLVERPDIQVSLDVLSGEAVDRQFDSPIVPLVDQQRVVVTPHIGGSSVESQSKAAVIALRLMESALRATARP